MHRMLASPSAHVRAARGFTLIEVVVAIAIVGIIAAVAIPSFADSMRKSRRSDAFAALSVVQQAQERWRANRATYAASVSNAADGDPPGLALPATTLRGYYSITLSGATATGYTALATAVAGTTQANDGNCVRLRVVMNAGNITYGSAASGGDFDTSVNNRCWVR